MYIHINVNIFTYINYQLLKVTYLPTTVKKIFDFVPAFLRLPVLTVI